MDGHDPREQDADAAAPTNPQPAGERQNDFSILETVEGELRDVEIALGHLDDGTYGTCEACGQPIGDERLEAVPTARFCEAHQGQAPAERSTPG